MTMTIPAPLRFGALSLLATLAPAQQPSYRIELLGPGTLVNDMNEAGDIVGWTTATGAGVQAFVAGPHQPFATLPLPPGYTSAWAQGCNDARVVVGSASRGGLPEFGQACAWIPDGLGGYRVQLLGQLPGHTQSVAYDVNNRGDIVGVSVTPGFQGGPTVWFNAPAGVLNLTALGAPTSPKQVNDEGVVVGISGGLFDLDTLRATPLPPFPAGWSGFQGWAINDRGDLAGTGRHGSQRSAAIWTAAGGWQSISPRFNASALVQAFDINDDGLTTAEVPRPAARLPGASGTVELGALLEPAQQGRWVFVQNLGNAVNDTGHIGAIALDTASGQSGVVLMTPGGCQADLGFQGPGTATAKLCGSGLGAGESSDYLVVGAPALAPGAVLVSQPGFANVPVLGGTLVSFGGLVVPAPVTASGLGTVEWTLGGLPPPVRSVVFQSVFLDGRLPLGVAFTNAVEGRFGE